MNRAVFYSLIFCVKIVNSMGIVPKWPTRIHNLRSAFSTHSIIKISSGYLLTLVFDGTIYFFSILAVIIMLLLEDICLACECSLTRPYKVYKWLKIYYLRAMRKQELQSMNTSHWPAWNRFKFTLPYNLALLFKYLCKMPKSFYYKKDWWRKTTARPYFCFRQWLAVYRKINITEKYFFVKRRKMRNKTN